MWRLARSAGRGKMMLIWLLCRKRICFVVVDRLLGGSLILPESTLMSHGGHCGAKLRNPSMQSRISRSSLQWRHNGRDSVSNHQPHDCLLNRLFRRRSKKTSKLRVTGLCVNSPHKWPVTRKMFPFDDVIMFTDIGTIIPLSQYQGSNMNNVTKYTTSPDGMISLRQHETQQNHVNILYDDTIQYLPYGLCLIEEYTLCFAKMIEWE